MNSEENEPELPSDPERAAAAFAKFLPRALALSKEEHVSPRGVNRPRAALAAIALSKRVNEPELRELYGLFPKRLFDIAHVNDLEDMAYGCVHAIAERASVESDKSQAKVPLALVEQSTAHKERMFTTAEYYLKNDIAVGPELIDIRKGTGHSDIMLDLRRLSKVFRDHEKVLKVDQVNYLPTDAAVATRLANQFADLLAEGQSAKQKEQIRNELALFSLLRISYDEVAITGRWLHRGDPDADFPTLIAASRRRVKTGSGS